jgi:hypothetical protein
MLQEDDLDTRHFDGLARRLSSRRTAMGALLAGLLLPLEAASRGKSKHRRSKGNGKSNGKGRD